MVFAAGSEGDINVSLFTGLLLEKSKNV